MKTIKIILKIIILCIGFYIGYKCYYLYKYNVSTRTIKNYEEYEKFINNSKELTIITKKEENVKYLEYKNIKIRNDWGDTLELMEDNANSVKYVSYDENRNIKYSIWIFGPEENTIDAFINESKNANKGTYKKYYEENKVYDIISLFKYLRQKQKKPNLFTNLREIEWYYTMNAIPAAIFEGASDLQIIKGDYNGIAYTYKNSDQKSIIINKNDESYGIQFFGLEYFTDEYINILLETLIIE